MNPASSLSTSIQHFSFHISFKHLKKFLSILSFILKFLVLIYLFSLWSCSVFWALSARHTAHSAGCASRSVGASHYWAAPFVTQFAWKRPSAWNRCRLQCVSIVVTRVNITPVISSSCSGCRAPPLLHCQLCPLCEYFYWFTNIIFCNRQIFLQNDPWSVTVCVWMWWW